MVHLKQLLAGLKATTAHTRASLHGRWTTRETGLSTAWARAGEALAPGRRWLAGWLSNLTGLLPGSKPQRTRLPPADQSNPVGGGPGGSRVSAPPAREYLGRRRKSCWAFFQQFNERATSSRAPAKIASKFNTSAKQLRQIDWGNTLDSWRTQLKSWAGYVVRWSRRRSNSWAAAIPRRVVPAGRIPSLAGSSRTLRYDVVRLGHCSWTNAVSTWQVVVAKLSDYAMRRGLTMARNSRSKSPSLIYLGNRTEFLRVDPECPLGYARQLWSAKAMDAYLIARGATDWDEEIQVHGECPIGYVRQVLVDPSLRQDESAEFHPESFLLILSDAYSKVVESRAGDIQDFAPVVPLVDVYARLTSPQESCKDYSKQEFTRDVYRLHASGVDTTEDGAKVSFPISRGVRGKTLTTTNETGGEVRYYGIRFHQRSPVAQS